VAIRIRNPDTERYRDTGKTCLGGGRHCPSASSFHWVRLQRTRAHPRVVWTVLEAKIPEGSYSGQQTISRRLNNWAGTGRSCLADCHGSCPTDLIPRYVNRPQQLQMHVYRVAQTPSCWPMQVRKVPNFSATRSWSAGIFNGDLITNLLLSLVLRELWQEAQLSLRDRATRACQLKSGKVLHKCRRLVFEKLWN